jgi:hypothetical protein
LLETNSSTHPKKDLSPKLIHQSTERSELFTILRLNKFIFSSFYCNFWPNLDSFEQGLQALWTVLLILFRTCC